MYIKKIEKKTVTKILELQKFWKLHNIKIFDGSR